MPGNLVAGGELRYQVRACIRDFLPRSRPGVNGRFLRCNSGEREGRIRIGGERRGRWPLGGKIPWISDERALRCKENVKNPTLTPQRGRAPRRLTPSKTSHASRMAAPPAPMNLAAW